MTANLTREQVELLQADFAPLAARRADLPGRLLDYVLDAREPEVLDDLAALPDSLDGLRLGAIFHPSPDQPRRALFRGLAAPEVSFLLRLARVYEAAARKPRPEYPRCRMETTPRWLGIFLVEVRAYTLGVWPHRSETVPWLNAELVEEMLAADGQPRDSLVSAALLPADAGQMEQSTVYTEVAGFAAAALRHAGLVHERLRYPELERQVHALKTLDRAGVDPAPFAETLVELFGAKSKAVRELAEVHLRKAPGVALPLLERTASSARAAGDRERALRLTAALGGASSRAFLEGRRREEKKEALVGVIDDLIASLPVEATAPVELPPLAPVAFDAPLGPGARAAFDACAAAINAGYARILSDPNYVARDPLVPATAEDVAAALAFLERGSALRPRGPLSRGWYASAEARQAIHAFLAHGEVTPVQAARFLIVLNFLFQGSEYEAKYGMTDYAARLLTFYRNRHAPPLTLRDLAESYRLAGGDPEAIGRHVLYSRHGILRNWGAEAVGPYFIEHADLLERAFEPSPEYIRKLERAHAFLVLAMLPAPPPRLTPMLWALAFGTAAGERRLAQDALENAPDRLARTRAALTAGKAETRAAAAGWLGRQRERAAAPALHEALGREDHDVARAAMLQALEALGEPVDAYLDRRKLETQARATLAKHLPRDLSWFPFDRLPAVHWQDTGEPVAPEIVRAWLVQAQAVKSADPGPLFRRYVALLVAPEREALGQFVLDEWIRFDERGIDETGAPHRGLLAVAAACAGPTAAHSVGRYLREWYGARAAQCKALLQMLAWVDHPAATQLILAVADRFRTRSIQDEARRLAGVLAEERGWTVEDLADRSIPSAGLDERGVLALDYGPRRFEARLVGEDLALFDEDQQPLSALPKPRRDDDADKAAEAKAALSAARKELKSTVTLQRNRLYEALCAERQWRLGDWRSYLLDHPVAGALCRRLVWAVSEATGPATLVRALSDASLVDVEGTPVTPGGEATVRLAHGSRVGLAERALWELKLGDLGFVPLFDQLGREPYELAEDKRDATEVRDFEGHVLNGLALRGRLMDAGYLRGPFQGHTFFDDYRKRFEGLGVEALIKFSGAALNEEDKKVALVALSFSPLKKPDDADSWSESALPLGEVPPVLLSECWNDMRVVAALGSGHDPQWRRTVGWER